MTQLSSLAIIDLELGAQLVCKDTAFAKDMIKMLVDSFPKELKALNESYQQNDWQSIQGLAHKIRGGTSYCGTPRLKCAASNLENYLKSGKTAHRNTLFSALLSEMSAVKLEFEKL